MKYTIKIGFGKPEILVSEDAGTERSGILETICSRHPGLLGLKFIVNGAPCPVILPVMNPQSHDAEERRVLDPVNQIFTSGNDYRVFLILPDGTEGEITVTGEDSDESRNIFENAEAEVCEPAADGPAENPAGLREAW